MGALSLDQSGRGKGSTLSRHIDGDGNSGGQRQYVAVASVGGGGVAVQNNMVEGANTGLDSFDSFSSSHKHRTIGRLATTSTARIGMEVGSDWECLGRGKKSRWGRDEET